eukprot:gene18807-5427_t
MELADLGYPYPGAPFKRMMAIISKPAPTVTVTMHGVTYSDAFTDLCQYCLAKDPRKRPKYDSPPQDIAYTFTKDLALVSGTS